MGRNTTFTASKIVYRGWLIFDKSGGVRLTREQGGLDRDERAVQFEATLPKSLFTTPTLKAVITVPDQSVEDIQIDVEGVGAAIRTVVGADIDVRLVSVMEQEAAQTDGE